MPVAPRRNRISSRGLEPPWKVLGVSVEHARDVADAVRIAELDWEVVAAKPVFVFSGSDVVTIPGMAATVRQDPEPRFLALVTDTYKVVQNIEAFAMVDVLAREQSLRFGWAGEHEDGRKVFLTLSDSEPVVVGSDDVHDVHYMALTSHDRSTAVRLEIVLNRRRHNTRPVFTFPDVDRQVRFKHTGNVQDRTEEAQRMMPGLRLYLAKFLATANLLEQQSFSRAAFESFALDVLESQRNPEAAAAEAAHLFAEEPQTKWGAYCAVVRWLDQFAGVKGRVGLRDEQRAMATLSGVHSELKASAAEALLAS